MVGPDLKVKRGFLGYRSRLERKIDKQILVTFNNDVASFTLSKKISVMNGLLSQYMKLGWERISAHVDNNGTYLMFLTILSASAMKMPKEKKECSN